MSEQDKKMVWSWVRVTVAAAVTAIITILTSSGVDGLFQTEALKGVATAALVALAVTARNYFDPSDPRFGKGSEPEQ